VVQEELSKDTASNKIGYFAFTRKAANEARDRAIVKFPHLNPTTDFPWFRTLHSLAFRCLGINKSEMMQDENYKEFGKTCGLQIATENDADGFVSRADNAILNEINLARIKGLDLRTHYNQSSLDIEWFHFEYVERAYRQYKGENGLLDFTDLLEMIVQDPGSLPFLETTIIDESQDLSRIQWDLVKLLAKRTHRMYLAGDDDQCQPEGTVVKTNRGDVLIEHLNPNVDRILCYDREASSVVGVRNGYAFKKASRPYTGLIHTVVTDSGKRSKYTSNHDCIVRWKPLEELKHMRVVYLMQRGSNFRIGECQLFRSDGCVHAWTRARLEKAERMWFLKLTESKEEARFYENLFSYRYGIPQLCFQESKGPTYVMNQALLNRIFKELSTHVKARLLLENENISYDHPIYNSIDIGKRRGGSQIFQVKAGALLPQAMRLGVIDGNKLRWENFTSEADRADLITVYSLEVDKHHNYFADEILTHNCIYRWAGADVDSFLTYPGEVKVLDKSYRIPAKVHALAERVVKRIAKRQPKEWSSREEEGSIQTYGHFSQVNMTEGEWLVMAAANYMLDDMPEWLKSQGLLFERHGHRSIGEKVLSAVYGWEMLRKGAEVPLSVVKIVYSYLDTALIAKGYRTMPQAPEDRMYSIKDLHAKWGLLTDGIWHEVLTKISVSQREYIIALLRRGVKLNAAPKIKLSTIHGAKGGEADNVLLLTDLSTKFAKSYDTNPDDINRLLYVGITRTRNVLHLVLPQYNQKGFRL
jgi:hypothetical protein